MSKFYVQWNYMMENEKFETLEESKAVADQDASYTQQDIIIYEDETPICKRAWIPVEYDHEDAGCDECDIISFNQFGFYAPWENL